MRVKGIHLGGEFSSKYSLGEYLGGGGNGIVFEIKKIETNEIFAVKVLKKIGNEKFYQKSKERFSREIGAMIALQEKGVSSIVPVLDYSTNEDGLFWYIMPKAISIKDYFKKNGYLAFQKMQIILKVAYALKDVHELGYSHRDIKPENILVINGNVALADFGLVWHTEFDPLSFKYERIGPVNTIAPEMQEDNPDLKHSNKADIYSFSKTLWMLITSNRYAFYGQYNYNCKGFLDYLEFEEEGIRTFAEINNLLIESTNELPFNRPGINEVISGIEKWFSDNESSSEVIKDINVEENLKRSINIFPSDVEEYQDFEKIRLQLHTVLRMGKYSFKAKDFQIYANKIERHEIDGMLLLFDTLANTRYLIKPVNFRVHKSNWKATLRTDSIEMSSVISNEYYDYRDFASINAIDYMGVDSIGELKTIVYVITTNELYTLNLLRS